MLRTKLHHSVYFVFKMQLILLVLESYIKCFFFFFRDNITWGEPFNKELYEAAVECCALNEDFKILPHGDLTEVGENGVTLSGGQKARISLARAVYQVILNSIFRYFSVMVGFRHVRKVYSLLMIMP